MDPSNLNARRSLGDIFLKEEAKDEAWDEYHVVIDEMISREDYEEAIKLLESFRETDAVETGKRLIAIYKQRKDNDRLASELIRLADRLVESDETHEAIVFYKEALEVKPGDRSVKQKIEGIEGVPEEAIIPEPHIEQESAKEHISVKAEKSADEIFTEVDIFARYGLLSEAQKLLESLRDREPDNIDVHTRLITIYREQQEKELAVSECLMARDILQGRGETEAAERMMKEAREIYPDDARLQTAETPAETPAGISSFEPTSYAAPDRSEPEEVVLEEQITEDVDEKIAEADVYMQQGLSREAGKILEELQSVHPDNSEIRQRLSRITGMSEAGEAVKTGEPDTDEQDIFEIPEEALSGPANQASHIMQESFNQDTITTEKEGYEDFSISEQDIFEAQDMPEPVFDSDVMEVFDEFKKGLEKELGDEDSETHYNLGIAYKEMGLLDDAIKEFQTARKDPLRNIQSLTMLGLCYMDKGLFTLAIESLEKALAAIDTKDESYWAIQFDLAAAYEKNSDPEEALRLYTEVFGWNAKFRNVADKVNEVNAELSSGETRKKKKDRKDRVSYL
jgi:tetratricopeptide (TPR) repeat protein